MRVLYLERTLANLVILGVQRFANLWLLPAPKLVGERLGIAAEDELDSFYPWFYGTRYPGKVPPIQHLRSGALGSVLLERVAEPGELGHTAFGPAVWVFSAPKLETVSGNALRAGYSDQPHVKERDRLALAQSVRKESE